MGGRAAQPGVGPVGRELELAAVEEFLLRPRPGALLLTGGPGIGKTTIFEAALELARSHGLGVLAARPSGAETQLSFATLTDLLEGVDPLELAGLPALRRRVDSPQGAA